jgi:hypothetical protein
VTEDIHNLPFLIVVNAISTRVSVQEYVCKFFLTLQIPLKVGIRGERRPKNRVKKTG